MATEILSVTAPKGEWTEVANGASLVSIATQITRESVEEIGSFAVTVKSAATDLTALEDDLAVNLDWKDVTRNRDQGQINLGITAGEKVGIQPFGDSVTVKVVRS